MVQRRLFRSRRPALQPSAAMIVCALGEPELQAIEYYFEKAGATKHARDSGEKHFNVDRWTVCMAHGGDTEVYIKCLFTAGNGLAGVELSRLLPIMRPRFVLVCGIGGSLDPKSVGYGNVVFGTSIDWKGFDKIETTKDGHLEFRRKDIHPYVLPPEFKNVFNQFKNRMVSKGVCKDQLRFDISPEMMDAFHTWAAAQAEPEKPKKTPDGSYNIIPGKIVSWDYVLNSQEERDRLYREDTSQICIEMESGAISYATDIFNTDHSIHPCTLFVFRGISDLAAQKVDTPWRDFAAHAAAKFTFEFYRSLDPIHFAMR